MFDKKEFAKTLRALRKNNKLSVTDVCCLCAQYGHPIYYKSIYKWEKAERTPDLKTLDILCHIYNININDLLKNKNSKNHSLDLKESNFISMLRYNKKYKKSFLILLDYKGGDY